MEPSYPRGTSTAAVVLAGGSGQRMGAPVNKVYLPVQGAAVLRWSVAALDAAADVRDIVLVVRPGDRQRAETALQPGVAKLRAIVDGGPTRHASERRGLDAVRDLDRTDLVLVHDGARPFLPSGLLSRLLTAARDGGAVPGLGFERPVVADEDGFAGGVDEAHLRRMQTPQAFRRDVLLAAYDAAAAEGFEGLDTCDTVQRFSDARVTVVEGDERNIKITYPGDLLRVGAFLAQAEAAASGTDRSSTTVPKTMRP